MTPLHEAVGSDAAVAEVIGAMIDVIVKANNWSLVDAVDNTGNTALHVAARRGRPDIIPELVKLNPRIRNCDGDTPFHLAARTGHPHCLETMLQVFIYFALLYTLLFLPFDTYCCHILLSILCQTEF